MEEITRRIVARWLQATSERQGMEFPTEEALKTYLKEHPKAKARNHKVKKTKHDDSAAPANKKDVSEASKAIESAHKELEQLFKQEEQGKEEGLDYEGGKHLPKIMERLHDSIQKLTSGINSIPEGKDRDRAKKIDKQLDKLFEDLNEEHGYRWKGKRYMNPDKTEPVVKKIKPLVEELDKLLEGQRVLFAGKR